MKRVLRTPKGYAIELYLYGRIQVQDEWVTTALGQAANKLVYSIYPQIDTKCSL